MTWCGVEGHDAIVERMRRCLARQRFGSSFLFLGPPGVGKRIFSLRLAQGLLCERAAESALTPCLECGSCQQIDASAHPDVDVISRPADKKIIPLELLVGNREHRMREGLCYRISLRPSSGRRRIAIIDDADSLSRESANCLLKTLEEPPPGSVLILIGTSELRQLPTIRSRCQIVRFDPLPDKFVLEFIKSNHLIGDEGDVDELVKLAEGSLDRAREFADPELSAFMTAANARWSRRPVNPVGMSKRIREFVDAAGSESSPKRARLQQVVQLRMRHVRRKLDENIRSNDGSPEERAVAESLVRQIDRCLLAIGQIEASANLATLIACWVDDLCQEDLTLLPSRLS